MSKLWKEENLKVLKRTWDVAVDGGLVGAIELSALPENFVVTHASYVVETALTGGWTVTLGQTGGDADGFSADMDAFAGVDNLLGALVWNSTDDHAIPFYANSSQLVSILVATTAYTAGKMHFYFEGYQA